MLPGALVPCKLHKAESASAQVLQFLVFLVASQGLSAVPHAWVCHAATPLSCNLPSPAHLVRTLAERLI